MMGIPIFRNDAERPSASGAGKLRNGLLNLALYLSHSVAARETSIPEPFARPVGSGKCSTFPQFLPFQARK
jgi:hypothetical protein